MTLGLEFPLDNDWSLEGEKKRKKQGRPFGIPDISKHTELIKLADKLGFAALWMREVPVYDPGFGDGASGPSGAGAARRRFRRRENADERLGRH